MTSLDRVLAAWSAGLTSSAEVVSWADAQVRLQDAPSQALLAVSGPGPQAFLNDATRDDRPGLPELDFEVAFALRAATVDLASTPACLDFARAIAGDLGRPAPAGPVSDAYRLAAQVDDLLNLQHGEPMVVDLVRRALPPLMPACRATAADWLPQP